nr:LUD domain-containing protein [Paenibacillus hamazuiensis]
MANIAKRLGRPAPLADAPPHPFRGAPDFYKAIQLTTEEKIELFTQNWTALTGKVLVVEEAEAAAKIGAWLREVAAELGVQRVSRWEHDGLRALGLDAALAEAGIEVVPWREPEAGAAAAVSAGAAQQPAGNGAAGQAGPAGGAAAADAGGGGSNWAQRSELLRRTERCQLGLVWPDFAVANTGTLVLKASRERGRSVSLLTEILFAVFRADQLVTRMGEAFADITAGVRSPLDYPSSLNLITGPSRSADIENDLTIGIHGPGKVYAVIIK